MNNSRKYLIALFLICTTVCLSADMQKVISIPRGEDWTVDERNTQEYKNWLKAGEDVRDDVKTILASKNGNLQYWIRVKKHAKGQVAVAVGEAYWSEPSHRIMDILIDGKLSAQNIDPIAFAGGKNKVAVVLCDAEDLDGDQRLHIQIVSSKGSPDKCTLSAGIWWIANGRLTQKEAAGLIKPSHDIKYDVFIPGSRFLHLWNTIYKNQLLDHVSTENPRLNELIKTLYVDCVFGKLSPPRPPALPYKWFTGGGGYVGQWLWDTMFVGIAYAPLDDDKTMREAFENYWYTIDNNPDAPKGTYRYGMVPCHLNTWPPDGYSQIPILAWGCEMIWRQTGDRKLIERALPYLVIFDKWYSTERDTDQDGLIEYGAYKDIGPGMLQSARYETFDFHITLDDMKMTTHPRRKTGGKWYGNVEGVEQTCFLLMSERSIIRMARILGKEDIAKRYEVIVKQRIDAIQKKMWDPKTKFFYSLDRDSDKKIPVKTIQGFLTLTCGVATKKQAAELASQLKDPKLWWCKYPVPTTAMDEAKFKSSGFWRGDTWPATTYLTSLGLNRYGYHDLARKLALSTWALAEEKGVNEHYDCRTGAPLGTPSIGMCVSIWSIIVDNIYGVTEDFRTIRIPPEAKGKRLHLGKLKVYYPEDDVVELTSAFDREFTVVFPASKKGSKPVVSCKNKNISAEKAGKNSITFNAKANRVYKVQRGTK